MWLMLGGAVMSHQELLPSTVLSNTSTLYVMASCTEPEACCNGVTTTGGRDNSLRVGQFSWLGKPKCAGLQGASCREERCGL